MKHSKTDIHRKAHKVLVPQFEDQQLTSFAGLVIFQSLFQQLDLKNRLRKCFSHQTNRQYGYHHIAFLLVIHLLLGFRRLRDMDYYADDPMVKRVLGIDIFPSVSTISRILAEVDDRGIDQLQALMRNMVLNRLNTLQLPRLTLDFDGTVQSTKRRAEGSAVGFNKKKKGSRSYYPQLCTIAQTAQVLDVLHRPGNVHDSNGANAFIRSCVLRARTYSPQAVIESRTDSAFFNEDLIQLQEALGIEFTISVPFSRFAELKQKVEQRKRWLELDAGTGYFECQWKAKSWNQKRRLIFIRTQSKKQQKGPVQLDLFEPYEWGHEFKVIVTNKTARAHTVLAFHNGRGAQEAIISDLKTHCQQDYVPVKTLNGNKTYLFSGIIAHNLAKELQMDTFEAQRNTTAKRKPFWAFYKLATLRRNIIQKAGRFTRPKHKLTLTMSANDTVKEEIYTYLGVTMQAA